MKKLLIIAFSTSILSISCSKSGGDDEPAQESYLSLTTGQIRSFEVKDSISGTLNSYVQTSSNRDTLVGSRNYHVFDNSNGTKEYFAVEGTNYYTLFNLPTTISPEPIELLFLKSNGAVGSSWSQNFSFSVPGIPLPIPVTFTHSIKEKGVSKTTGSINHTNVIRVETKITSSLITIDSDIQTYVAPKYGVVHMTTYLKEAMSGTNILTRRTMTGANF